MCFISALYYLSFAQCGIRRGLSIFVPTSGRPNITLYSISQSYTHLHIYLLACLHSASLQCTLSIYPIHPSITTRQSTIKKNLLTPLQVPHRPPGRIHHGPPPGLLLHQLHPYRAPRRPVAQQPVSAIKHDQHQHTPTLALVSREACHISGCSRARTVVLFGHAGVGEDARGGGEAG